MDLVRTLGVAIDPRPAQQGGAAAQAAFRGVGQSAKEMEQQTGKTQRSVSGLSSALGWLKTAVAGLSFGFLIRELYQTTTSMQQFQNQLKYVSGTALEFKKNFDFVRASAQVLGMELKATGSAFGLFSAAAKGKLSGAQTREIFTAVSEASAALSLTTDQTSGALNALAQMLSKGSVQAEELRGQLGERLPGAFSMAAKAMGMTEKELGKTLETGGIMADELLPKLAKEMHAAFGPASIEGAKTLRAEMNRLKNAWTEVQMVVMGEGGESLFGGVIKGAKTALEDFKGWLAALFQANKEGDLSEAIAASLRIGFGKAANYFGGFIATASAMMAQVGQSLFSRDYFTNLLGAFSSVAASFGLAFMEALEKPLAHVQAFFEGLFDQLVNAQKYGGAAFDAEQQVLATDPRFAGRTKRSIVGNFGALSRNDADDQLLMQFNEAVATRTAQLKREIGQQTHNDRVNQIMAGGGPRFGFSGTGQSIGDLKSANQANLETFVGGLARQTAESSMATLKLLQGFKPSNIVDTSADAALLKGFGKRSTNPFANPADTGVLDEKTLIKQKSILEELKAGALEAAGAFKDMFAQAKKAGAETFGAVASGFTSFFDDIIEGTDNVARSFSKMAASILRDIAKIIAQRMIAEPMANGVMSFVGNVAGSYFGGMSGIYGGASPAPIGTGIWHSGGVVGRGGNAARMMDPAMFTNAPRFHNGLKPDEFPAILQRGEEVIPRNEARRATNVTIPINVKVDGSKGGSPEQNEKFGDELARQLKDMVRSVLVEELQPRGVLSSVQ